MDQPSGSYNPNIVHEIYVSYMASVYLITLPKGRGVDHPLLTYTLVKGVRVDVSKNTIYYFCLSIG